ncbi:NAD(P)-binding protein [Paramyrothecium foliicola]|nr:NAD(P)-binding protein [Paramyrothecium foliicola]
MLVLVAGVTGNIGQKLTKALTDRGHHVRGLGRNPKKLSPESLAALERFEACASYDDVSALNRACAGVDAIICAYYMDPRLQLEGQLFLLRAAERAGVETYVAASWSGDWSKLQLGMHEAYDAYVSFRHYVEMTSLIKPIYIYTGIFAETMFSTYGHGHVGPDMPLMWDSETKTMSIWGSGHTTWFWTSERNAAEFTAEIVQRDDAAQGGFWNVCSGAHTLREIAQIYQRERGVKVTIKILGSVDDLEAKALAARRNGDKRNYHLYTGLFYQLYANNGALNFQKLDNNKLETLGISIEGFLREYPQI